MAGARAVDGQAAAMAPYNEIFPFEAGGGASLDIATVVGAGQRSS
jgi:hypothetical protein